MSTKKLGSTSNKADAGAGIHRIKVPLLGIRPPIWRRIEVPSSMWVFETGSAQYGIPDRELGIAGAAAKRLAQVAPRVGAKLRYTTDFGNDWNHERRLGIPGPHPNPPDP